uniref:Uncharacterized protein n=1 Tax=Plectus sambesii TaxID=2011161 RepID=A0A914VAE5_9BILA
MAGRQSDQLVIQGELTEQELAELLAQQGDGVEGGAQIVDADGNVVTVSVEQLAAAGIDIDNMSELTEDQLGSLLALANQGPPATGIHTPKAESNHHQSESHHHQRQRNEPQQPPQSLPEEPSDVDSASDSLTMVIGEDGSLKLSDGSGQEFVLSSEQLAANNIDVNNLSDDQIQQIVQMAMPNFD